MSDTDTADVAALGVTEAVDAGVKSKSERCGLRTGWQQARRLSPRLCVAGEPGSGGIDGEKDGTIASVFS